MRVWLSALVLAAGAWAQGSVAESEKQAQQVIDAFFAAFNKSDAAALRKTVHFPHIRIAGDGHVTVVRTPQEWKGDPTPLAASEGWHHSTLDAVRFLGSSDHKVHAEVVFSRYRADGTRYATYPSLWIITRQEGRWGVQARSSFAP